MALPRLLASRLMQQTGRRYHGGPEFKPPSMDEMPVPHGSWQAKHNADQRRYNSILAFGVVFAVFSFSLAKGSGLLYFNYAPPKTID